MDLQSKEQIGRGLSRIPSGCSILTVSHGATRSAMLASWVQQAGFEPPAVTVAVNKERWLLPVIEECGTFALNVVGSDPSAMFKQFGKGFAPGAEAFEGVKTFDRDGWIGLSDAAATLACRVTGSVDAGDHKVIVASVVFAVTADDAAPYVHIRKNGLSY